MAAVVTSSYEILDFHSAAKCLEKCAVIHKSCYCTVSWKIALFFNISSKATSPYIKRERPKKDHKTEQDRWLPKLP